MCMVGDDYVELIKEGTPRAKKPHKCEECDRVIEVGERYISEAWIWEGEFGTSKTCRQCRAAAHWLSIVCSGWMYSMVLEDLMEHVRDEPLLRSSKLVRLVRYGRRDWRRRDGSLIPSEEVLEWAKEAVACVPPEARQRRYAA